MTANERLAGADPDDVGIRRRNRDGSNRRHRFAVEDWAPVNATVSALEDAARSGSGVDHIGVADHTRNRTDAVALRSDVPILEPRIDGRVQCRGYRTLLGFCLALGRSKRRDEYEGCEVKKAH